MTTCTRPVLASYRYPDDPIGVGRATNGIRGFSLEDDVGCGEAVTDIAICLTWFTELDGTRATGPVLDLQVLNPKQSRLFTGTDAGTVYAVDAVTGDVAWSSLIGAAVSGEPALADGQLFVPTYGRLVVLAAEDGDILWQAQIANPLEGQPAVAGGLDAGGVVFTADDNGTLHAFNTAGCDETTCSSPLWSAPTGSTITGAPAISQGQVYVGTADGPDRLRSPMTTTTGGEHTRQRRCVQRAMRVRTSAAV